MTDLAPVIAAAVHDLQRAATLAAPNRHLDGGAEHHAIYPGGTSWPDQFRTRTGQAPDPHAGPGIGRYRKAVGDLVACQQAIERAYRAVAWDRWLPPLPPLPSGQQFAVRARTLAVWLEALDPANPLVARHVHDAAAKARNAYRTLRDLCPKPTVRHARKRLCATCHEKPCRKKRRHCERCIKHRQRHRADWPEKARKTA